MSRLVTEGRTSEIIRVLSQEVFGCLLFNDEIVHELLFRAEANGSGLSHPQILFSSSS